MNFHVRWGLVLVGLWVGCGPAELVGTAPVDEPLQAVDEPLATTELFVPEAVYPTEGGSPGHF